MRFEEALKGMIGGKNATFARCTGFFFVRCVIRKNGKNELRLYYQTPEGFISRQHKLGVGWVLNCDWRYVDNDSMES